jgi:hypothetical protein
VQKRALAERGGPGVVRRATVLTALATMLLATYLLGFALRAKGDPLASVVGLGAPLSSRTAACGSSAWRRGATRRASSNWCCPAIPCDRSGWPTTPTATPSGRRSGPSPCPEQAGPGPEPSTATHAQMVSDELRKFFSTAAGRVVHAVYAQATSGDLGATRRGTRRV